MDLTMLWESKTKKGVKLLPSPWHCETVASRLLLWHCTVPFLPGVNPVHPTLLKELAWQRSLFFLLELFCYRYNFLLHCAIYQKALSCQKTSSNPLNSEGLTHEEIWNKLLNESYFSLPSKSFSGGHKRHNLIFSLNSRTRNLFFSFY